MGTHLETGRRRAAMTEVAFATGDTAQLVGEHRLARDRLDRGVDTLEIIADWKDDLRARIARRQLIFELVDFDVPFDDLVDETNTFKRVCRALKWRAE